MNPLKLLIQKLTGQVDDNTAWLRRQEQRLDQMEADVRAMQTEVRRQAEYERQHQRGAQ